MANDNDIKIGLQTVGADAAASEIEKVERAIDEMPDGFGKIPDKVQPAVDAINKIPDAIDKIPESTPDASKAIDDVTESIFRLRTEAQEAQDALDEIEAKRRVAGRESTGGLLGVDVSKGLEKAGQEVADKTGYGAEYRALATTIGADAVAIAGSVAAIGAATVASYKLLSGTVDGYKKLMQDAAAQGKTLGPEIEDQITALEEMLSPLGGLFDVIGDKVESMWDAISNPIDTLSGLGKLRESLELEAESYAKLQALRQQIATAKVANIEGIYQREANTLADQEETMRRIIRLRQEIGSIEQQRANNQVRIAQQDGGDVGLAEANALAVELKLAQQKLVEDLRQAQADQRQLEENFSTANAAYRTALTEGLDKLNPDEFQRLSAAYDAAQDALNKGQETLPLLEQKFREAQVVAAEDVEIKLFDLRDKYGAALTKEADATLSAITSTLADQFSAINAGAAEVKDGIAQIQVDQGAITTAATQKAAEVSQSLSDERAGTVAAVQQLAPQPQDRAAVIQAIQSVGSALAEKDNAMISALAAVQGSIGQTVARIANQQVQINQLFARLR